jgi:hypothetical protein
MRIAPTRPNRSRKQERERLRRCVNTDKQDSRECVHDTGAHGGQSRRQHAPTFLAVVAVDFPARLLPARCRQAATSTQSQDDREHSEGAVGFRGLTGGRLDDTSACHSRTQILPAPSPSLKLCAQPSPSARTATNCRRSGPRRVASVAAVALLGGPVRMQFGREGKHRAGDGRGRQTGRRRGGTCML